jgi:hypothetical protein
MTYKWTVFLVDGLKIKGESPYIRQVVEDALASCDDRIKPEFDIRNGVLKIIIEKKSGGIDMAINQTIEKMQNDFKAIRQKFIQVRKGFQKTDEYFRERYPQGYCDLFCEIDGICVILFGKHMDALK